MEGGERGKKREVDANSLLPLFLHHQSTAASSRFFVRSLMLYPTELRGRFSRDKKVSSAFFPFYPRQWRAGALERREEFSSSQPFFFLGLDSAHNVFPGVYKSLVGVEEGSGGEKKERTEEKELSVQRGKKVQEEGKTFDYNISSSRRSLPRLSPLSSPFIPSLSNRREPMTSYN